MITTDDTKPIIALCTPKGAGAIALIRISGDNSIELVNAISKLSSSKKLIKQKSHTIHHGYVIDGKEVIDEVLFFLMKAPKTFTGQDTVEISCHNNLFIINQIIQVAIAHGAHQAQRGEFSKRAFLNKKIDLIKAEAINELIAAQTEIALKKSMAQLKGSLSSKIVEIETELLSLLTHTQASFEFLDEEQKDLGFDTLIKKKLNQLLKDTCEILKNFSQQKQIREGIKIAILGNVNVGKSTLFNALVNKERAIVTNTPGTTRDAIETSIFQNGNFWLLVDTAGVRESSDTIEQKGIEKSWQEASCADIIIVVFDGTKEFLPEESIFHKTIQEKYAQKSIIVINKIDAIENNKNYKIKDALKISAKNNIGIDKLKQKLEEKIKTIFEQAQSPYLLNQRQYNLISELNIKLKKIEREITNKVEYELLAYELNDLLKLTTQLTGKTITDKMMDAVFKTFCIGK